MGVPLKCGLEHTAPERMGSGIGFTLVDAALQAAGQGHRCPISELWVWKTGFWLLQELGLLHLSVSQFKMKGLDLFQDQELL